MRYINWFQFNWNLFIIFKNGKWILVFVLIVHHVFCKPTIFQNRFCHSPIKESLSIYLIIKEVTFIYVSFTWMSIPKLHFIGDEIEYSFSHFEYWWNNSIIEILNDDGSISLHIHIRFLIFNKITAWIHN